MKKFILLVGVLVSLAALSLVRAQTPAAEGVITYEMKVNLHRNLTGDREGMKAMIPEFRTTKHQLFFNATESLYKLLIEDAEEESGGGVQIKIGQTNDETYLKPSEAAVLTRTEFFGKNYLISDTLKIRPWKFGTETKEILGYVCRQAYYTDMSRPDRKMEVTAWYTDQIRAQLGPERYASLPGAVLAVDINNGERVLVARNISIRSLKKAELKVPSTGIQITQAEYRKIVEEQMKKMGAQGGVIIRN